MTDIPLPTAVTTSVSQGHWTVNLIFGQDQKAAWAFTDFIRQAIKDAEQEPVGEMFVLTKKGRVDVIPLIET